MEHKMRLIDADALKAEFTGNFNEMWHYTGIRAMIDVAPTVDAVEAVRCKHCKQWNCVKKPKGYDKLLGYCLNDDEPIERWENDFCSYGERKDNDN